MYEIGGIKLKKKSIKYRNIMKIILVFSVIVVFSVSCDKDNNDSNEGSDQFWGFGNSDKIEINNSYNDKISEAAKDSYTYYTSEDFQSFIIDQMNGNISSIYDENYQELANSHLQEIKELKTYTYESPLFIMNPFGTNTCGMYIYMGKSDSKLGINYTISINDKTIADFSESMFLSYKDKEIEGQLIGLLQGRTNKVVLEVLDSSGNRISKKAYYFDIADLDSIKEQTLRFEFGDKVDLSRGLFAFHAKDDTRSHFLYYDNYGVVRAEIPTEMQDANTKILQVGNNVFYGVRDDLFVLVNNLGYIENYYPWEYSDLYTEFDTDIEKNKVLFIVNASIDENCTILGLDLNTGEYKEYLNIEKLMRSPMKFDEMQVVDGKDIIVNSNEMSSIIRINNIYTSPVIRWIIADESLWKDSNYETLLLYKKGNFQSQFNQKSIYYSESRKLKEGQFYLSLFHFEGTNSQKSATSASEGGITTNGMRSFYYQYLVDESVNGYQLVKKIEIPDITTNDCMAMPYGGNVIISIGALKEFREYNSKGEIMSKYYMNDTNFSNPIFKYTMGRYWF